MYRDQKSHQEDGIQRTIHLEINSGQDISDDKAENQNQNHRQNRRADAVQHGASKVVVLVRQYLDIVFKRRIVGKSDDVSIELSLLLQRRVEHPYQRENAGQREKPQHCIDDNRQNSGTELLCRCSGTFDLCHFKFFLLCHFIPPPYPSWPDSQGHGFPE